tara:strand:- start:13286 stop:13825 length:540 start_codon:yes stop_codon:yes gene_type:complete
MNIIQDFLPKDYFDHIYHEISGCNFPWLYQANVGLPLEKSSKESKEDHFYFVHRLYENFIPESSFFETLTPLLENLKVRSLLRARVLMYVNQGKQIIHDRHIDYPFDHTAALIYMNDCNGFTEFEIPEDSQLNNGKLATKIERVGSVANTLVTFNGSVEHSSSNCTDEKHRLVLAINYF